MRAQTHPVGVRVHPSHLKDTHKYMHMYMYMSHVQLCMPTCTCTYVHVHARANYVQHRRKRCSTQRMQGGWLRLLREHTRQDHAHRRCGRSRPPCPSHCSPGSRWQKLVGVAARVAAGLVEAARVAAHRRSSGRTASKARTRPGSDHRSTGHIQATCPQTCSPREGSWQGSPAPTCTRCTLLRSDG